MLKLFNEGNYSAAVTAATAMALRYPSDGFAFKVLGPSLHYLGKSEEAVKSMEAALKRSPNDVEAHANLGGLLNELERYDEAEPVLRNALEINPQSSQVLNNLSVTLLSQRRPEEAEVVSRKALVARNDYAEGYNNLGNALYEIGNYSEAAECYKKALQLNPKLPESYANLGKIANSLGQYAVAETYVRQALALKPSYPQALSNLGTVLKESERYQEAEECYRMALELNPRLVDAWSNLSLLMRELGRDVEATEALNRALTMDTKRVASRLRKVMMTLPTVCLSSDQAIASVLAFDEELAKFELWLDESPARLLELKEEVGVSQPFYVAYRAGNHRDRLKKYGSILTKCNETSLPVQPRASENCGKIKLLIVSAHIRRHSVWDVVLKGLVRHLDRNRFQVDIFHAGKISDEETEWCRSNVDRWLDLSQANSRRAWVESISELVPDVIFYPEIGMDRVVTYLAAQRLAPLQMVGWGHPITSGLPTQDLFLSGDFLEKNSAESHYSEKLVRLPGVGCCTEPLAVEGADQGCLDEYFEYLPRPIFVIAQQPFKLDPEDDVLYVEIAKKVGRCTLLLLQPKKQANAFSILKDRLFGAFTHHGLDPSVYIKVVPWLDRTQFYSLLENVDIYLDCPSFSGYTTAWQAAHRGLPIVTLEGEFMRQRLAAGLLRQIGQTDTIAQDRQAYVEIAASLAEEAQDRGRYVERRAGLKAAAGLADHRVEVVRAFEETIINQLAARDALPEGFGGTALLNKELRVAEPAFDYPWQQLDADLHFHSLKHDYAPVGLLQMVSTPPREVLDVGCFCGGTGRWLKKQFPTARVTGIEMLEKAAAVAREVYEEVHVGKFEDIDISAWQGRFDTIIAADVLEHMYNPWSVLQKLSALLAPGGAIYISLPNIRNLSILMGLAGGEWRYAGAGILDITHIRFFTKAQILEMLEQTGWQAGEVRINADPRLMPSFQDKDLSQIKTINAGKLKLEDLNEQDVLELLALQFFIRATPAITPGAPQ
ncbi:tetratricopeptide repeat protein [Polaromonas sp. OV174]|uniref:tetratricopeptide repeat protein n=1 Tax=Polaromonas sp. OV174 TaxID=1855300 RepID=UPI0015A6EBF2|nr:tetratricopeptide repeat protein [Polaromonas sp. OV174]